MGKEKGVEAVERALSLLDCFDQQHEKLSLAELAQRSGLYKSTILRLAVSLERFGYLERLETGEFTLGRSLWRLGSLYRGAYDQEKIMRSALKQLVRDTGETASCYIREQDQRLCLYRCEPDRAIRHSVAEGSRLPLDKGASGHILQNWTQTDPDTKPSEFEISLGERDAEVAAIAVPVQNSGGVFVCALALSGPLGRFDDLAIERHKRALIASAQQLSSLLIADDISR